MATLLNLVQTVCNELGLNAPSAVVGAADLQTKQLYALANRVGKNLFREHPWTVLRKEQIINIEEPTEITGDVTTGSAIITGCSSTVGLDENFSITGEGMPTAQRIVSNDSATQLTCQMLATATAADTDLTCVRDTFELNEDFDQYMTKTWWDRTNHWMTIGPDSQQTVQWLKSGIVATGPRRHWTQVGRKPSCYRVWPPPTSQDTPSALSFVYISNFWVVAADDTTLKAEFTADTDEPLLNEQMFILDMKWRFQQIKGFAYAALQAEAIDFINAEKARDGGMADLSMNQKQYPLLIGSANVQDGNFPGPA